MCLKSAAPFVLRGSSFSLWIINSWATSRGFRKLREMVSQRWFVTWITDYLFKFGRNPQWLLLSMRSTKHPYKWSVRWSNYSLCKYYSFSLLRRTRCPSQCQCQVSFLTIRQLATRSSPDDCLHTISNWFFIENTSKKTNIFIGLEVLSARSFGWWIDIVQNNISRFNWATNLLKFNGRKLQFNLSTKNLRDYNLALTKNSMI